MAKFNSNLMQGKCQNFRKVWPFLVIFDGFGPVFDDRYTCHQKLHQFALRHIDILVYVVLRNAMVPGHKNFEIFTVIEPEMGCRETG